VGDLLVIDDSGSLVLHVYIRGYMYMEVLRILLSLFHCVLYLGNCWVAIKFSTGMLTTNA
jgi:hypothetical protein